MEDSGISEEATSKGKTSLIQEALTGLKTALMGTLFVMAKDSSLSFKMNLLGMVIDWLQLLAFPFNLGSLYPWNYAYSDWFAKLCFYSKLEFYISPTNSTQNLVIYLICVLLVFSNLVNACIVGYRFVKKKAQNVFLLKFLRSVASLVTTVLYMPFLSQFAIMFSCSIGRLQFEGCPYEQRWLLMIVSPVISVMFGLLSIIVASSFFEQDYTSDDVSARPHARVELFYLVFKGIITIFYSLYDAPEYHYYQIFMVLALGVPVTFCYIYYLPYYHYLTTVIQAQFVASFTWAGLCLLLCRIQNNADDAGPITLFFIGVPCIFYLVKEACDWRRDQLINKTIHTISSPYEVELHTRFLLLTKAHSYKTNNEEVLTEAEDFYYLAERKFPNSSILKLFVAQFHLTYRNRQEAIPKLEQAEQRNPALDEQFIIYKTRQSVGKDAIVFVTFSSYLDSAHRAEQSSLAAQRDFWHELSTSHGSAFQKLTALSRIITKNIDLANSYYKYLMNIDRTHRKMLPMYVYFLEDVLMRNDYEVKNLRNRVQDMRNTEDVGKSSSLINGLTNGAHPQLTISLDKGMFAQIENLNASVVAWLQLPKARMMNQSLALLMPECLRSPFVSYLEELRDLFNEDAQLADMELHFLDKDGYLLGANCTLELIVEDLAKSKRPGSPTKTLQLESPTSKRVSCVSMLKKRIAFTFRPVLTSNPVLIIDPSFKILHVNRAADFTFGINFHLQALYDVRDLIPNFEMLLNKILRRSTISSDYMESYSAAQTFILSKTSEFIRIKIQAKVVVMSTTKLYIIEIQKLSSYSRQTQKFFKYFIGFLETYLGTVDPDSFKRSTVMSIIQDHNESEMDEVSDIKSLMKYVKTQVEAKNQSHSPELKRVNYFFLFFLFLISSCFISSFLVARETFGTYSSTLYQIQKHTDIQSYTLLLSETAHLLDAHRQGLTLPYSVDYYYGQVTEILAILEELIEDASENSTLDELSEKSVECLEYSPLQGYTVTYLTPLDALLRQLAFAQQLVEGPLEDWDVQENSYAFWVYENGIGSLRVVLEEIGLDLVASVDDQRVVAAKWAYAAAAVEVLLCVAVVVACYPLLAKSDQTQHEILVVFLSIPAYLLQYLKAYTENALKMRQDSHYPDCRPKYKTQKEIWEDSTFSGQRAVQQNRQEGSSDNNCKQSLQRVKRVACEVLSKRILTFVFLSLCFIAILQLWYCQLNVLDQLADSSSIVKDIGTLNILLVLANVNAVNTALSPYTVTAVNVTETVTYVPSSFNSSYEEAFQYTEDLRAYLESFLVGSKEHGVDYSYMYPIQVEDFFTDFFETTCEDLNSCQGTEAIFSLSLLWSTSSYCFDVENLCNILADEPELTIKQRWAIIQPELQILLREQTNLWYLGRNAEDQVTSYYISKLDTYATSREIVLVCYCLFSALYYGLWFRKSLIVTARKEQLTRSMLLLLPERIVTKSVQVQKALIRLKFE